jgi:hypothetical protein
MNPKVNYVITTWSGPRREPNLSYLKNHLFTNFGVNYLEIKAIFLNSYLVNYLDKGYN